jgi:hypothetical protein
MDQEMDERFRNVLDKGNKVLTDLPRPRPGNSNAVKDRPYFEWQSQSVTLLQDVFGPDHRFTRNFESGSTLKGEPLPYVSCVEQGMGVLDAAYEDLSKEWTRTLTERVHSEVFDDYLDMAEHLLKNGSYFVAAVVLAGATLEEHLRKLSAKHGLPVVDSIDTMNQALWKQKQVYPQSTWRSISSWYDLRTDAAHGKPRDYAHQEVQLMISGVRDLISRYPA